MKKQKFDAFVQPTFYNISDNLGGAWTLPATIFFRDESCFGTASLAYQRLEGANINNDIRWFSNRLPNPKDRFKHNKYAFFSFGKNMKDNRWSLGGSFFYSELNAMNGVDLLYRNSVEILQDGNMYEVRGGLMYKNEFSSFEALILFNKFKMQHDVKYIDASRFEFTDQNIRLEKNIDHTNTLGIHVSYKEKANNDGLNIGVLTTVNLKTHPKIPNYEIMNIPRDPGDSWAFNFGIGIGIEKERSRFGIDLIYEPIWSNTWAEAAEVIDLGNGNRILPGQKTVENDFAFSNIIGRIGYNAIFDSIDLGFGLEIYNRSYDLDQFDYVQNRDRSQEEEWAELTWTWGVGFHFKHFIIRYNGHIITGAGIPGIASGNFFAESNSRLASFDIIAAPSGTINIEEQTTSMHQFILQIPLDTP